MTLLGQQNKKGHAHRVADDNNNTYIQSPVYTYLCTMQVDIEKVYMQRIIKGLLKYVFVYKNRQNETLIEF